MHIRRLARFNEQLSVGQCVVLGISLAEHIRSNDVIFAWSCFGHPGVEVAKHKGWAVGVTLAYALPELPEIISWTEMIARTALYDAYFVGIVCALL